MDSTTKSCSSCKNIKPFFDFNTHKKSNDGLQSMCKQCSREYEKRSRQRNKERPQDIIAASIPCIKLCRNCNTEKTQSEFPRSADRKDGLDSRCLACHRLKSADYRLKFRDRVSENKKAYYESNKKQIIIATRAYYEANKERAAISRKAWVKANPERNAAFKANRRARKNAAPGSYTGEDIKKLMILQRGKCAACKTDILAKYHVDHVMALVRGGSNDKSNLQLLCQRCNNQKCAKDPIDFMRERGYLL